MNKNYFLSLILILVSQFATAGIKFCFDPDKITGDSTSLKLSNLSKLIENDKDKKGINCVFDGVLVPNRLSILAYKEKKGNCSSEFRTCAEGTLSGSYAYLQCDGPTVTKPKSSTKSESGIR